MSQRYWSTGSSPTTSRFFSRLGGVQDTYLALLSPAGALVYASYFGGDLGDEEALGIALTSRPTATIVGVTTSSDLPVSPGAVFPTASSAVDGFVVRFSFR